MVRQSTNKAGVYMAEFVVRFRGRGVPMAYIARAFNLGMTLDEAEVMFAGDLRGKMLPGRRRRRYGQATMEKMLKQAVEKKANLLWDRAMPESRAWLAKYISPEKRRAVRFESDPTFQPEGGHIIRPPAVYTPKEALAPWLREILMQGKLPGSRAVSASALHESLLRFSPYYANVTKTLLGRYLALSGLRKHHTDKGSTWIFDELAECRKRFDLAYGEVNWPDDRQEWDLGQ